jgi:hypothetical protein
MKRWAKLPKVKEKEKEKKKIEKKVVLLVLKILC